MSEHLKPYNPSEKGRELIALLFPLSHIDREKNIEKYSSQYPQEKQAVIEGFHYIVQEIVETRHSGLTSDLINLPEDILTIIIQEMLESKNFFSYDSFDAFFNVVFQAEPSVFKDPSLIDSIKNSSLKSKNESGKTSSLPENYSPEIDEKLKSVCKTAEKAYGNLTRIQRSLINSQKFIDSYKSNKSDISLFEVKLAKETFLEAKQIFVDNGAIIAKGMPYIYEVYQRYSGEIVVKKAYIKYLAKLLGSREARNPPENYVIKLANGDFDYNVPDFEPTDQQLQHGKTKFSLKKEYDKTLQLDVNRLEARYRKRKLTAMLKKDVPKTKLISDLTEILKLDPLDIKTHIFLAKLLADYANTSTDHAKRGLFKEQALKHCEAAFSKIDDYLDLQAIKEMKERDIARSGFVKTISSIRIPLIKKK